MSYSDSDDDYGPSDDDEDDDGGETLAELLERTRREQAAQREAEAEEAEGTPDELQEGTTLPAPVEPPAEDGFVGPPGLVYAQPRTPYAGTIWRGDKNMFERINRDDASKPKGTRPAGYIWNEELLGWRRTEAQTLVDEARLAAQAQARQQPAREKGVKALPFGPDVPDCTWIEYSFFVSACGHHVPLAWFDLLTAAFTSAVDTCGGPSAAMLSLERGDRKNLLHIQGITRLLSHDSLTERVRNWMRAALLLGPNAPYKCKIMIKPFTNQEWGYMGGYVQKDMGKPHYRLFHYPTIDAGAYSVR